MEGKNIVLIGMPGAGKSTVGVLLAKAVKMPFIDTDLLIQAQQGRYLQELIDALGVDEFIRIEEKIILSLGVHNHVIATGGSVVYSESAVKHLQSSGFLVFLDERLGRLEERLVNACRRGIAMKADQSLRSLYEERLPLYKRYADIIIDCADKNIPELVSEIVAIFSNNKPDSK